MYKFTAKPEIKPTKREQMKAKIKQKYELCAKLIRKFIENPAYIFLLLLLVGPLIGWLGLWLTTLLLRDPVYNDLWQYIRTEAFNSVKSVSIFYIVLQGYATLLIYTVKCIYERIYYGI